MTTYKPRIFPQGQTHYEDDDAAFAEDEKVRIAALHKTAPEIIWLQIDPEAEQFNGWDDQTWCSDRINETDVKYVRADLTPNANVTGLAPEGDHTMSAHDELLKIHTILMAPGDCPDSADDDTLTVRLLKALIHDWHLWQRLTPIKTTVQTEQLRDDVARLRTQRDYLLSAARRTLDENGHLADGDVCTLSALKRAVETLAKVGAGDTALETPNAELRGRPLADGPA